MLRVCSVTREFEGIRALDMVSFDAEKESITALIGPNGAGKTTLINIISGVVSPSAGHIEFDGIVVSSMRPDRVANMGIRRTFQTVHLFHGMTVRDNLIVGRFSQAARDRLSFALALPGWSDSVGRKRADEVLELMGLRTVAEDVATDLPYGLQRRVEIARALCGSPRLLLLDEPAAGMNQAETEQLRSDIAAIREQGITILLIEHDMSLVMSVSDRVVVLDFGRRIADGTPAEVQRNAAVISSYLGSA